jgi:hypothetical protein
VSHSVIVQLLALNYKIKRIKHMFHGKGKTAAILLIFKKSPY